MDLFIVALDQRFVFDMLIDPADLGIARGQIELANGFDRQVVAAGVETIEHGAALHKLVCNVVQRYGIAKPMHADLIAAWCDALLNKDSNGLVVQIAQAAELEPF